MTEGVRGMGALFLGAAAWLAASHIGMNGWQLWAVGGLVALGSAMIATGRLSGW